MSYRVSTTPEWREGSGNEASCLPNYGRGIEMYRHARALIARERECLCWFVAVACLEEMERR
jgi:hypothetical protein